jgi:hypothetical protein
VAQVIQLRGIAHLDNDDADSAEKDYLFSIRLNQSLRNGFMVDYLVAIADRTIDDAILWEGLRRHVWNVAQLNEMDSALGSKDLLKDAISSFRIERASGVQASYFLQKNNPTFIVDWGQDIDPRMYLLRFVGFIRPAGWWNQDRRRYSLELQTLIEAIDAGRGHLDGLVFDAKDAEKQKRGTWKVLYVPMSTLALSMGVSLGEKVAEAETYRRLARIACWLEEYRLTHQQYPDTLDQLPDLPSHLNQEVLTGKPLHYWRKEEGYVLYSTSWDQKDHGGVARTSATEKAYDWLWPSP